MVIFRVFALVVVRFSKKKMYFSVDCFFIKMYIKDTSINNLLRSSSMIPQKISNGQKMFFFDLSLSDVYGIGCAALSLIYYGSRRGAFHQIGKKPVDLDSVDAIRISLNPRIERPLSDRYQYHLIYYRNNLAQELWNHTGCGKDPEVKHLTRRVRFVSEPSLEPHRLRHFYIKSNRPLHLARYGHVVPTDDYVPRSYVHKLSQEFMGFLMRSPREYSLSTSFFAKLGLGLVEKRNPCLLTSNAPHIWTYVRREPVVVSV
jgi:hypothetical protein